MNTQNTQPELDNETTTEDAAKYGAHDAQCGVPPMTEDYGFQDEEVEAYLKAYQEQKS